ncbi:MAG: DUF4097 family beta strand repeat protein [Lachnospiraceae bacterium]|nr:DUF4097 family beta strand repeat protein [Lachnospiraceae bacterium]
MRNNTISKAVAVIGSVIIIAAVASGVNHIVSFAGYDYEDADKYTAGDAVIKDTVSNLDIDWTCGNINFEYHDEDTVEISEKSRKTLSEDKKMRWWLDGDTLRIRFAGKGSRFFSLDLNQDKELTVRLPESISLGDVVIDSTSGDVLIPPLQAQKVTLDMVSGDVRLELSGADELHISTVTGNVDTRLDGVKSAEIDTTSGDVKVSAPVLEKLDIDVTTGDVTAALSEEPGFTAHLDTVTGNIVYDLPLTGKGGTYVCGDGSGSVEIDTTTGDIAITSAAE